ncbi:MAG: hypothetical protein SNJ57_07450 [Cyanobacteriota bacterium]
MQIRLAPTPPKARPASTPDFIAALHPQAATRPAVAKRRTAKRSQVRRSESCPSWSLTLAQWLKPPAEPLSFCAEGGVWLAGGAVFRVAMHQTLLFMPQLWIPVAIALLTPAIVATALSVRVPRLSLLLGYRLCLIAAGLFLTGFWL